MKTFALILRIISYIDTVPALVFFFYFVLIAVGGETKGMASAFYFVISILILVSPVALNLLSRHLDGTLYNR